MRADAKVEAIVSAALLAGGALWVAAPEALPHPPCLFHALTGYACLTCGGTRALAALRSLDVGAAFLLNPLVTLAAFAALAFLLYSGTVLFFGVRPLRPDVRSGPALTALRVGLPLAIAANWIYLLADGR